MLIRFALAVVLVGGCYNGPAVPIEKAPTPAPVDPTAVTPRVRITEPDPNATDGGQRLEGWPPIAYDHLPAVSIACSRGRSASTR
jgi:hypothetical protein